MIELSVVIVTYNSGKYLYNCLDSISKFNDLGENLEVIVVDNFSKNEVNDIKIQTKDKFNFDLRIYYSGGNLGYGSGNNYGFNKARGKYLCFLNPDTILIQYVFKKAIDKFLNRNIRTVGLKLYNEHMKPELSYFFIRGYLSSLSSFMVIILNYFDVKFNNMITSGACLFIRSEDFLQVGGFSSKMFLYHEESFLARKCSHEFKNNVFYYDKSLKIIHLEKTGSISENLKIEYYKSMAYYYRYFKYNETILLMVLYFKDLIRTIYRKITFNQKKVNSEYRLMNESLNLILKK